MHIFSFKMSFITNLKKKKIELERGGENFTCKDCNMEYA